jgi:hypothetical protein
VHIFVGKLWLSTCFMLLLLLLLLLLQVHAHPSS